MAGEEEEEEEDNDESTRSSKKLYAQNRYEKQLDISTCVIHIFEDVACH